MLTVFGPPKFRLPQQGSGPLVKERGRARAIDMWGPEGKQRNSPIHLFGLTEKGEQSREVRRLGAAAAPAGGGGRRRVSGRIGSP